MKTPTLVRRKFTVDEYHRMAEVGILCEDERIELIDGEIIVMSPIGPLHMGHVARIGSLFSKRLSDRAILWIQNAIRLSRNAEPEPDVALLRPRADFYTTRVPGPADVFLIVEVADTSLAYDRRTKLNLYAIAAIPEVWIVDLRHHVLLVHRNPSPAGYGDVTEHGPGSTISPLAFRDLAITHEEVFGTE